MDIFKGVEIMFFWLGVLSTLAVVIMVHLHKVYGLNWKTWITSGFGAFFFVFCVAWSVSSVLEGEPQAAALGLVFFGSPAIVLFLITRRMILKKSNKNS
ncbi:hypothetical protein [Winogradskyella sp.]|uniref:hypothetical protein n=1 Tax=Winogradskyella sp. TaxID=1883156 RepID=UPI00260E8E81|nr:hypothetical protein [Winogradskyella sp.]